MDAFDISAVRCNGSVKNGVIYVDRTSTYYTFDYNPNVLEDGLISVKLYRNNKVVPYKHMRDARNAVREHFKR